MPSTVFLRWAVSCLLCLYPVVRGTYEKLRAKQLTIRTAVRVDLVVEKMDAGHGPNVLDAGLDAICAGGSEGLVLHLFNIGGGRICSLRLQE